MSQVCYTLKTEDDRARLKADFPYLAARLFHLCDILLDTLAAGDESAVVLLAIGFPVEIATRFEARMRHNFEHGPLWKSLPRPNFILSLQVELYGAAEEVTFNLAECATEEGRAALCEELLERARYHYRHRFTRKKG